MTSPDDAIKDLLYGLVRSEQDRPLVARVLNHFMELRAQTAQAQSQQRSAALELSAARLKIETLEKASTSVEASPQYQRLLQERNTLSKDLEALQRHAAGLGRQAQELSQAREALRKANEELEAKSIYSGESLEELQQQRDALQHQCQLLREQVQNLSMQNYQTLLKVENPEYDQAQTQHLSLRVRQFQGLVDRVVNWVERLAFTSEDARKEQVELLCDLRSLRGSE